MEKLKQLIQEMIAGGFTQAQVQELIMNLDLDIFQKIFEDAAEFITDEEVTDFETRLKSATTVEMKDAILNEIARKAYGDQVEEKKAEITYILLQDIFEKAKAAKDLYDRYQKGDPDAVNKIQEAMKTEEFKQAMSEQ